MELAYFWEGGLDFHKLQDTSATTILRLMEKKKNISDQIKEEVDRAKKGK